VNANQAQHKVEDQLLVHDVRIERRLVYAQRCVLHLIAYRACLVLHQVDCVAQSRVLVVMCELWHGREGHCRTVVVVHGLTRSLQIVAQCACFRAVRCRVRACLNHAHVWCKKVARAGVDLVQHAVQEPIALLLVGFFDRFERRQQAKYVHVDVVEEQGQHVHRAYEIGEFAFAFQVEAQKHWIVAQTDYEHTAHLFDEIEKDAVARVGKRLLDVSELVGHFAQAEIGQELACFHACIFRLVHHLIADQQELEYLQYVVRVGGINNGRDETVAFGERVHRHRKLDST